eukprot:3940881-Rhodomonas_salina.2
MSGTDIGYAATRSQPPSSPPSRTGGVCSSAFAGTLPVSPSLPAYIPVPPCVSPRISLRFHSPSPRFRPIRRRIPPNVLRMLPFYDAGPGMSYAMRLRAHYAMSSTERAYGATRAPYQARASPQRWY